jgi:tetratricopeptide (TPR) repeat protein
MRTLIVGGTRAARIDLADRLARASAVPSSLHRHVEAAALSFSGVDDARRPETGAGLLRIDDVEQAVPNRQRNGTRLILTQSGYLLQRLLDVCPESSIIVTGDREELETAAPEALQGRGPWRSFTVQEAEASADASRDDKAPPVHGLLPAAYAADSADERVALCQQAVAESPDSAVAWLCLGSACLETQDIDGGRAALARAAAIAPEWDAVHFELGKFWLGVEDLERARDAFQRAADLRPTFSPACSNLGAVLGELDEPEAALASFQKALAHDPDNSALLNNVGVVTRELGRLEESEAALTRVTRMAPGFVFGHYNLAHTRFFRGDYRGAIAEYEEGLRLDPQKNRRQGCRLAMARFASADIAAAERELWHYIDLAPPGEREDLLIEAYEVATALSGETDDGPKRAFIDRLARAMAL